MTEPTTQHNKVAGKEGAGGAEDLSRLNRSDLFAALVDRPLKESKQSGIAQPVPREIAELLGTVDSLRGLDLPPAQTAFKVVLRGKLLTRMINTPAPVSGWERLSDAWANQTYAMRRRTLRLAVSALTVLAFALASTGTAYAAQSALPGDPLYVVKTGLESVQLALTPDDSETALHLSLADRRLAEIEALAAQARFDDIDAAVQALSDQLFQAANETGDPGEVKTHTSNAVNALLAVYAKAPESARPAIEAALLKLAEREGVPVELPVIAETPAPTGTEEPVAGPEEKPTKEPNENAAKTKTQVPPGLEKKTEQVPPGQLKKTTEP